MRLHEGEDGSRGRNSAVLDFSLQKNDFKSYGISLKCECN
jgi:hypothetical protein